MDWATLPPRSKDSSLPLKRPRLPNLDPLAKSGAQGRMISRRARHHARVTGRAHLGLFGYDPVEFQVGAG